MWRPTLFVRRDKTAPRPWLWQYPASYHHALHGGPWIVLDIGLFFLQSQSSVDLHICINPGGTGTSVVEVTFLSALFSAIFFLHLLLPLIHNIGLPSPAYSDITSLSPILFLFTRVCIDPRGSGLPLSICSCSLHLLKIDREDFAPQSGFSSSSNPTYRVI